MPLLDARQKIILLKVGQGKTYRTIGKELNPQLSEKTVNNAMVAIIRKLGARDRTSAVLIALFAGCFTAEEQLTLASSRFPAYRPGA